MKKRILSKLILAAMVVCLFLGINSSSVDAADALKVGKSVSGTAPNQKFKEYTIKVDQKMKVQFTLQVMKSSGNDDDDWYSSQSVSFDMCDNDDSDLMEVVVDAGKKKNKTVVLDKGTYTFSIYGYTSGLKYKVTTKDISTYAKKISIPKKLTVLTGESKTLKASVVSPKKSYLKKVTWTSSNKKIATVNSSGKVTGKKAGTCKITAKLTGGNKVTCTVTIKKAPDLYVKSAYFSINSVGGIEPTIMFKNNFKKTIKYVDFNTYFYNAVGDPAKCDIRRTNKRVLNITGPLKAGKQKEYYWDPVIYNWNTHRMYIKNATVTFTDGSKKTVSIKKSFKEYK